MLQGDEIQRELSTAEFYVEKGKCIGAGEKSVKLPFGNPLGTAY
jgi:hypothetical protein